VSRFQLGKILFVFYCLLAINASVWSYSIFTEAAHKWGDPSFGTGATVTYSFMGGGVDCSISGISITDSCSSVSLGGAMPVGYKDEIRRAFDAWQDVANDPDDITNDAGEASIASQLSGDIRVGANSIDGAYSILAYAFFPYNNLNFSPGGDIQFDSGEIWTIGDTPYSFDIFSVALHEIGHSLGLDHELTNLAIMNPYYNGSVLGLQSDDIAGIQAIYGAAIPKAVPAPGTFGMMLLGSFIIFFFRLRDKRSQVS